MKIQALSPIAPRFASQPAVENPLLKPYTLPFEAVRDSGQVVLYRGIAGPFLPQDEHRLWSLDAQSIPSFPPETKPLLLQTVMPQETLRHQILWQSGYGRKIELKNNPPPADIVPLEASVEANVLPLRKIFQITKERHQVGRFSPEEIAFKASLYEWAMGLAMARDNHQIEIPADALESCLRLTDYSPQAKPAN